MKLTVVGVMYENTKTGAVADDIFVLGNNELSECDIEKWLFELRPRYCSKIVRKKGYDNLCYAYWHRCETSELTETIQAAREVLDILWQCRYECGEAVPPSFVSSFTMSELFASLQ